MLFQVDLPPFHLAFGPVMDNIIRYRDWMERPINRDVGLSASEIHNAVYGNNIITLGGDSTMRVRPCPTGRVGVPVPEECNEESNDPPGEPTYAACLNVLPEGMRRAWFNNRNHLGELRIITWVEHGRVQEAAQQQWP